MERQKLGDKMYVGKPFKASKTKLPKQNSHVVAFQKHDFGNGRLFSHFDSVPDDSSSLSRPLGAEPVHFDAQSCNGAEETGFLSLAKRVSFNLDFKSKKQRVDLRMKLENELNAVRNLMRRIERYGGTKLLVSDGDNGRTLKRVHSEIEVDASERRQYPMSMPGGKNSRVATGKTGYGTKTSMSTQFQKNSNLSLSKEKISSDQTRKQRGGLVFSSSSKVFKSCSALLDKLMKQRGGWVFNTPVDAERLGLYDYFTIIEHPMDLGTVKSRLTTNWYKTPKEFVEDVRLTFHNAMIYNMEGHEVNTLARQFLNMFEDKWVDIEAEYLCQLNVDTASEADLPAATPKPVPTPAPRRAPPTSAALPPHTNMSKSVDWSEAVRRTLVPEAKTANSIASGKTRLPKPKAKDLHKREMTLQEKQKLSASLQNLPPEKLEGVLQIIKKRNASLFQSEEEIEVDIDSVDTETLWELDRFVIYYKKNLSKMKRSAELGLTGVDVEPNLEEKDEAGCAVMLETENETDEKNIFSSSSNDGGKRGVNARVSDDLSSSSSDSESSSSGTNTDGSSS